MKTTKEEKMKRNKEEVVTTDLIEGQVEYYLRDDMHNIKKITIHGKPIGVEVVFKLPEVPLKSKYRAIKVLLK